jgi:hypothetical protein
MNIRCPCPTLSVTGAVWSQHGYIVINWNHLVITMIFRTFKIYINQTTRYTD